MEAAGCWAEGAASAPGAWVRPAPPQVPAIPSRPGAGHLPNEVGQQPRESRRAKGLESRPHGHHKQKLSLLEAAAVGPTPGLLPSP